MSSFFFQVAPISVAPTPGDAPSVKPWSPPQRNLPQKFYITANIPTTEVVQSSIVFNGQSQTNTPTTTTKLTPTSYFFDALLMSDHIQRLTMTRHPTQAGASIVDHAYLEPSELTLEIGMSDCMSSYKAGQFTDAGSRSVSAFQTLEMLQALRSPLQVFTKLKWYSNMFVTMVRAVDTSRTRSALRAHVTLSQVISGTVLSTPVSARSAQTGTTNEGPKSAQPISPDLQKALNSMKSGVGF